MTDSQTHSVKRVLPWLVAVAFFMESLDTTILNTAIPVMAEALKVVPLSMKSVLSSYTLSLAVFIPISSWMADRFGSRAVFSWAIGLFTLGSVLCGLSNNIHLLVLCRIIQGCGGAMMVPVGRLTLVKTFQKSELIRAVSFVGIPALIGPMLGPLVGGIIVNYFNWRMIFFVNVPIGILGFYFVRKWLPDYREKNPDKLDFVGLVLFGSGVALLSYVLEVFGEHTLTMREILGLLALSILLLTGYGLHARAIRRPVLRLGLLRFRTVRASVGGNFFTRLGAGGMPFLLPLLYQVGLGLSPIQSGLLIIPQPLAALGFKFMMPKIIEYFGYRKQLLLTTLFLGLSILLFSTIGTETSMIVIVIQAACFGFFSSLQFTSMNTLAYSEVSDADAGMTSTIVSTVQQMSISFGVATASLAAALFIPDRFHSSREELVSGIHHAFILLGILTILSSVGFSELKKNDGDNISQHKEPK